MATQNQENVKDRVSVIEPGMYDVLLINDDFTTMEFVVELLRTVFYKNEVEANKLMLEVHHNGQAVVGTYTLDIAQSKVDRSSRMAHDNGFPLRLKIRKH